MRALSAEIKALRPADLCALAGGGSGGRYRQGSGSGCGRAGRQSGRRRKALAAAWSADATRELGEARAAAQAARDGRASLAISWRRPGPAWQVRKTGEGADPDARTTGRRSCARGGSRNDAAGAMRGWRRSKGARCSDRRCEAGRPAGAAALAHAEKRVAGCRVAGPGALGARHANRRRADRALCRCRRAIRLARVVAELGGIGAEAEQLGAGDEGGRSQGGYRATDHCRTTSQAATRRSRATRSSARLRQRSANAPKPIGIGAGRAGGAPERGPQRGESAATKRRRSPDRSCSRRACYERALASALGEDLESALSDWKRCATPTVTRPARRCREPCASRHGARCPGATASLVGVTTTLTPRLAPGSSWSRWPARAALGWFRNRGCRRSGGQSGSSVPIARRTAQRAARTLYHPWQRAGCDGTGGRSTWCDAYRHRSRRGGRCCAEAEARTARRDDGRRETGSERFAARRTDLLNRHERAACDREAAPQDGICRRSGSLAWPMARPRPLVAS